MFLKALLRDLFLGTLLPVPGNLFLGTCSWEPVLGNLAWEPVLGTLLGNLSWEPCLGTCFLGTLLGNLLKNLRKPVSGNLLKRSVKTCSWDPGLGTLGNLAWEPLGTCSWEPCLGTCFLGTCFLGTCFLGTCLLGTLLGNLFLGTFGDLAWEPWAREPCFKTWNLGTLGIRIFAAPTCSETCTMAEDP